MCEFISWIEVTRDGKKEILYLDDQLLAEKRTKEILEGSKDNDFLGHHAIRAVWSLKDHEGQEGEVKDFWNTSKLPAVLQAKLKDFSTLQKHFGSMLSKHAQPDDLDYILAKAPENKRWHGLKGFCLAPIIKGAKTEDLTVNARYDLSIEKLVEASKLDYVNSDFTGAHFKEKARPAEKNKKFVLLHLNRNVSTETVLAVMKQMKLKPGTAKELVSVSIDHPDLQRKFPIVANGSVWRRWRGGRRVPYLWGYSGGRDLDLDWYGGGWGDYCRFLALRES